MVFCVICYRNFKNDVSLKNHQRLNHNIYQKNNKKNLYCHICDFQFNTNEDRIDHLNSIHHLNLSIKKAEFDSEKDFLSFKTQNCNLMNLRVRSTSNNRTYYRCNTNFNSKPSNEKDFRNVNFRINKNTCPTFLIKVVNHDSNKISIEYLETHTHQLNNNKRNEFEYHNLENQFLNLFGNDNQLNLDVQLDIEGNDSQINLDFVNLDNNQKQIEELNYKEQCKSSIKKLEKLINESTDLKLVALKLKECVNSIERLDKKSNKE